MSETINEQFQTVDTAKKRWVDFENEKSNNNEQQQIVKSKDISENDSSENELSAKNISLPPPPRSNRQKHTDNQHNDNLHHSNYHNDRSSKPTLDNSPSSSSSRLNQIDQSPSNSTNKLNIFDKSSIGNRSIDKSIGRSIDRSSVSNKSIDKLSMSNKSNDIALNMPDQVFVSSSSTATSINNLQNVSLRDTNSPAEINNNNLSNSSRFKNGDILVTLLPLNTKCAWLTPAIFKPHLVPEELMSPEFRLTVEDYVHAMSMLINDYRFNLYVAFYKRITLIWLTLGFCILFSLLFSNSQGIVLYLGMLIWVILNAFGFFLTCYLKVQMIRNLERCVARVNEHFYKFNIILIVDDVGKLSCHKINLIFMYFNGSECIKYLNDLLNRDDDVESINNTINNLNQLNNNNPNNINLNKYGSQSQPINMEEQDVEINDIIITGNMPQRFSQKDKYGTKLFLRYSQRFGKDFVRQRVGFNTSIHYDSTAAQVNLQPRHCDKARCVCQYVEEHMQFKPYQHCGLKDLFG